MSFEPSVGPNAVIAAGGGHDSTDQLFIGNMAVEFVSQLVVPQQSDLEVGIQHERVVAGAIRRSPPNTDRNSGLLSSRPMTRLRLSGRLSMRTSVARNTTERLRTGVELDSKESS